MLEGFCPVVNGLQRNPVLQNEWWVHVGEAQKSSISVSLEATTSVTTIQCAVY